ncbi:MAG: hypothetical protein JST42_22835, partial [Bacteroidetes bacterium]|nr:hypothetical protein [Bacteroidota bacterium]
LFAGLLTIASRAQLKDALSKATASGASNAGSLLKQFAGAIKPTSFLSSWSSGGRTDWLGVAGKVSSAVSMAKSVSGLAGFIKPDMFKQGFNVGTLTQAAGAVKSYSEAGNLLKNLEGGLKPGAFLSSWASKRPAWLSALNMLK